MAGDGVGYTWTLEIPPFFGKGELPWGVVGVSATKWPDKLKEGCTTKPGGIAISSVNFGVDNKRGFLASLEDDKAEKKYPSFDKVDFSKEFEASSMKLHHLCLTGKILPVATFVGWTVISTVKGENFEGGYTPVFFLQLEGCGVSSVSFESESLSESYEMQFQAVRWGTVPGAGRQRSVGGWTFLKNQKL